MVLHGEQGGDQALFIQVVRPASVLEYQMIALNPLAGDERQIAQGASVFLSLMQDPASCREGLRGHLLGIAFRPVWAERGVIGRVLPDDLRVAGDRRRIGLEEVPFPGRTSSSRRSGSSVASPISRVSPGGGVSPSARA